MEDTVLKIEDLAKRYGEFSLNNVNLQIPKGYIMGFSGQNGAGKSTTIRCIMNLISFEKGKIEVFGLDNRKYSTEIKSRVGYVSEDHYFYENMTVEWTGNFIGSFFSKWDGVYFDTLLKKFNVDKRKKVRELSKGMKMKLSLSLAIAHRPELLILDEPTSGLDPIVRNELLEIFQDIMQSGECSIFFSTHITSDIEKVADYITIIDNGKILLSEEKDLILNKWVVVKAENRYYNERIHENLVGLKMGDFGYSGITDNIEMFSHMFRNDFPEGNLITSKINLDEYLLRVLKKEGETNV